MTDQNPPLPNQNPTAPGTDADTGRDADELLPTAPAEPESPDSPGTPVDEDGSTDEPTAGEVESTDDEVVDPLTD